MLTVRASFSHERSAEPKYEFDILSGGQAAMAPNLKVMHIQEEASAAKPNKAIRAYIYVYTYVGFIRRAVYIFTLGRFRRRL